MSVTSNRGLAFAFLALTAGANTALADHAPSSVLPATYVGFFKINAPGEAASGDLQARYAAEGDCVTAAAVLAAKNPTGTVSGYCSDVAKTKRLMDQAIAKVIREHPEAINPAFLYSFLKKKTFKAEEAGYKFECSLSKDNFAASNLLPDMNNIAGRKESFISFPVNPDYVSALCTFPAYVKPSPKMPISMNGSAASM